MGMFKELKDRKFFCYQCGGGMYRRNHRWKCFDTFRKNGLPGVRVHYSTAGILLQTKNDRGDWETLIYFDDSKDPENVQKVVDKIDHLIEEREKEKA